MWGLLVVQQCSKTRTWQELEIAFLQQVLTEFTLTLQPLELGAQLRNVAEQDKALFRVITKIRQTLDLDSIFKATTQEVRHLLGIERIVIYKFRPDYFGDFIAESVSRQWPNLVGSGWEDSYLNEHQGGRFQHSQPFIANDIYEGEVLWEDGKLNLQAPRRPLSPCHIEVLEGFGVKAFAVVAIFQGQKLWGLLSAFQNSAPHAWLENEINLLLQVAAHLGTALQQAEKAQELEKTAIREQTLNRLITKIRRPLGIETIFQSVVEESRQVLNCDRVVIYRFNPDWSGEFVTESVGQGWLSLMQQQALDTLRKENFDECNARALPREELILTDTYLRESRGGVYTQGNNFKIANDIYNENFSDCYVQLLESFQARAYIIVAVYKGSKIWGLLAAYQNSGPREWDVEEIRFLNQIGIQLGIALQNAENTEQLMKTIEREQALNRVIARIRQSTDLNTIFNTTTQEVRRLLGIERVTIYRFREDYFGDFVSESEAGGFPKLVGSGWEDSYLNEHQGGRFRENLPLIVNDIYAGEILWENGKFNSQAPKRPLSECHIEALEFFQVRACAVVAIFRGSSLWGLLSAFQNTRPRQWEEMDIKLLMQVAVQLSVAIQEAESVEQLKRQSAQLSDR